MTSERGFALLAVMLALSLLIVVVLEFAFAMRLEASAAHSFKEERLARAERALLEIARMGEKPRGLQTELLAKADTTERSVRRFSVMSSPSSPSPRVEPTASTPPSYTSSTDSPSYLGSAT